MTFFGGGGGRGGLHKKYTKNLKYLMTKKVYEQKHVSVITKNLNCEILTKNLVTFKRWDGDRDQKI